VNYSNNIIILSLPRNGSSLLANLITSAGYKNYISEGSELMNGSDFNIDGYFEDTLVTLLNDQLIKATYGEKYSFLYIPELDRIKYPDSLKEFEYDIDEHTLFVPEDYQNKIEEYIGCNWDVWGLTRMIEGKKWYNCYSKFNIQNLLGILKQKETLENRFNNSSNTILKDPRMALTYPLFKFNNHKIIYIQRNPENTLNSMKRHYGKNIFTQNYLPGVNYCSNHFNYKIEYQDFNYYFNTYHSAIQYWINEKKDNYITIDFDDLLNKDPETVNSINEFIGGEINIDLIR
jgi:hypothetical protein